MALLTGIYRQQNDLKRAETLVREAIERNPKSVDLRDVLASLDADGGDTAAAEQQMREVIKLRPNELSRRTRLAVYLARQRRLDDAQQVLVDAVKALPDDAAAKLQLVDFVASQRSREHGEKTLREFIAADKSNDDLRLRLGSLLQRAGANEEAIKVYREALVVRRTLARAHLVNGEPALAEEVLREGLRTAPSDAGIRIDLAQLLTQTNRAEQAPMREACAAVVCDPYPRAVGTSSLHCGRRSENM